MAHATYALNTTSVSYPCIGIGVPCDNIAGQPMICFLKCSKGNLANGFVNISANCSSVPILFTSKILSLTA